uniref:Uncharacterized protein n=1 Tax=Aegilops tauschii TaxID=37682 RepID=N1QYC7_AEGTA
MSASERRRKAGDCALPYQGPGGHLCAWILTSSAPPTSTEPLPWRPSCRSSLPPSRLERQLVDMATVSEDRVGMDELDMDGVNMVRPEFACPVSLSPHL